MSTKGGGNGSIYSLVYEKQSISTSQDILKMVTTIPTEATSIAGTTWSPTPIVNVYFNVGNDADSGFASYWALDNYVKSITVWESTSTPTRFCALNQYGGQWRTFAGALSPQFGIVEPYDGNGIFNGGYVATFKGTFLGNASTMPLTGFIGAFDLGGSKADILLNDYGKQKGSTNVNSVNWRAFYFNNVTEFAQPTWVWVYGYSYPYNNAVYKNMWVNASSGSFGDIICTSPNQESRYAQTSVASSTGYSAQWAARPQDLQ